MAQLCRQTLGSDARVTQLFAKRMPRLQASFDKLGASALSEIMGIVVGHIANASIRKSRSNDGMSADSNQCFRLLRLIVAHQMVASHYADRNQVSIEQRHYLRFQALIMAFEDYCNATKNKVDVDQLVEQLQEKLGADYDRPRSVYLFARGTGHSVANRKRKYTVLISVAANAESLGFCLPGAALNGCSTSDGVSLGAESQMRAMLAIEAAIEDMAPRYVSNYVAMGFSRGAVAVMQYAQLRRQQSDQVKPCRRVALDPVAMYRAHCSLPVSELERVHANDEQLTIEATEESMVVLPPVGRARSGMRKQRLHFATDHIGAVALIGNQNTADTQTARAISRTVVDRLKRYGLRLHDDGSFVARYRSGRNGNDLSMPEVVSVEYSLDERLQEYEQLQSYHDRGDTARENLEQQRLVHIQVSSKKKFVPKTAHRLSAVYVNRFGNGSVRFYNEEHRQLFHRRYPMLSK